jgi:ferredoxin
MSTIIPVTLLFADGVSHRLAVPCGGRLMDAAQEAGLNLLTDCSNGQCGTCTAQLVSGSVEMDDYDSAVLSDADRGWRRAALRLQGQFALRHRIPLRLQRSPQRGTRAHDRFCDGHRAGRQRNRCGWKCRWLMTWCSSPASTYA